MNSQRSQLHTAGIVPFTSRGDLDGGALVEYHRWLQANGVDGVFACGTTGEFIGLGDDERTLVIASAVEVFGPARVIAHVGAPTLRQASALLAAARDVGATRFSAITPWFERAHPAALLDYYARLSEACDGQLYVYHFPDRTGVQLTPEALAGIAERVPLLGIKVSGLPAADVLAYQVRPGFEVFTGNDASYAECVRGGAAGAISGLSSAFPEVFVAMRDALAAGDEKAVTDAQAAIDDIVRVVQGANFALVKKALDLRGIPAGPVRVALDQPTPAQVRELRDLIARVAR